MGVMETPLRKLRHERGWTLAEVAAKAHIDIGSLSRIERGKQRPGIDVCERLIQLFDGEITEMQILYPSRNGNAA